MGRFHALLCLVGVSCAILVPQSIRGQGGCGQECQTLDDCQGQLICANGQCNDDPDVGTHICSVSGSGFGSGSGSGSGSTPDGGTDGCQQSGTLRGTDGSCDTSDGSECCKSSETYTTYTCSPPVSSQTPAVLTWNNFEEGGSGGGESQCDEQFHSNSELIVALSTGWFDNERRCRKQIKITAETGQSVEATVVDQCDSTTGCDKQHDFQPPCRNNVVDGSSGVWDALGLNKNLGTVSVTWSDT